jgi:hypothetical protein
VAPTPDEAVYVHSVQEEYFHMMVHPCACGGPWQGETQEVGDGARPVRHRVEATCFKCKAQRTFHFALDAPQGPKGPIRQISATPEPSRALDVVEWLDLAQFYLGRIGRLEKAVERAQSLLDARQCLEEAMKFYPASAQDPPPAAVWSDRSRQKAAQHPDLYRRASLETMLSKIPPMDRLRQADKMEQREFQKALKDRAKKHVGRKWWQFWRLLWPKKSG